MIFEPRDVFQKLEFDKVIELLEKEAVTPLAGAQLRALMPSTSFSEIDTWLREAKEFKLTLEKNDTFPLETYSDLKPDLKMLEIEDYTLSAETFQKIHRILINMRDIFRFFTSLKQELYPRLYDRIRSLTFDEGPDQCD